MRVGNLVRVSGWIKIVALLPLTANSIEFSEARRCDWKIHVHRIERVEKRRLFVAETVYWLEFLTFLRRLESNRQGSTPRMLPPYPLAI